jgi:hypothetical protein
MHKRPRSFPKRRTGPRQCSGVDQRLVRERSRDQLSHEACARSLCRGTVADAQGLRFDSDRALCERLSMTGTALHQARPALSTRGLVASHHPLYQLFALDPGPREAPPSATPVAAEDDPVDLQAVFARLWEVWS